MDVSSRLMTVLTLMIKSEYSLLIIKVQDNSFAVYADCQKKFPDLLMQWLNAEQGKSRALNLALYNSDGKYIINLDSDGILEKNCTCQSYYKI